MYFLRNVAFVYKPTGAYQYEARCRWHYYLWSDPSDYYSAGTIIIAHFRVAYSESMPRWFT
jgi:hypothetical protein